MASGLADRTMSTKSVESLTQAAGAPWPLLHAEATAADRVAVTANAAHGSCEVTRSAAAWTTDTIAGAAATRTGSPAAVHPAAVVADSEDVGAGPADPGPLSDWRRR